MRLNIKIWTISITNWNYCWNKIVAYCHNIVVTVEVIFILHSLKQRASYLYLSDLRVHCLLWSRHQKRLIITINRDSVSHLRRQVTHSRVELNIFLALSTRRITSCRNHRTLLFWELKTTYCNRKENLLYQLLIQFLKEETCIST